MARRWWRAFAGRLPAGKGRLHAGALALVLLFCATGARAHQAQLSRGELRASQGRVDCRLRFAVADLRAAGILAEELPAGATLATLLAGPEGATAIDETLGLVALRTSGDCVLEPGALALIEDVDGVELRGSFHCPPGAKLEGNLAFLERLGASHTLLLQVFLDGDGPHDRVLQADAATFSAEPGEPATDTALRFLRLGVEHIFSGADHLAFLIALLLLGGSLGQLVKVVTAFTAAHSVTLALAALGLFSLSPRIVEPLIAASIAAVAAENLWALRGGGDPARALRHRWLVSFGFGLVHGFGFADALRETGLPRDHLALALAMFNLGVECGQVCVIAVALPLLRRLLSRPLVGAERARFASALLGLAGLGWLVVRLRG